MHKHLPHPGNAKPDVSTKLTLLSSQRPYSKTPAEVWHNGDKIRFFFL